MYISHMRIVGGKGKFGDGEEGELEDDREICSLQVT